MPKPNLPLLALGTLLAFAAFAGPADFQPNSCGENHQVLEGEGPQVTQVFQGKRLNAAGELKDAFVLRLSDGSTESFIALNVAPATAESDWIATYALDEGPNKILTFSSQQDAQGKILWLYGNSRKWQPFSVDHLKPASSMSACPAAAQSPAPTEPAPGESGAAF